MQKTAENIDKLLSQLESCKTTLLNSLLGMMQADNRALYTNDLLLSAVGNRAISLIDGFLLLAKSDNYLCALPLIRLQLDNSLRFYATSLVEDSNDFFNHFASGEPIRNYRSKDGKKLSDNYLATQLELKIPGIKDIYRKTSSYIHLSDQHLRAIIKKCHQSGNNTIGIGANTNFSDSEKRHITKTMLDVTYIANIIINGWRAIKDRNE